MNELRRIVVDWKERRLIGNLYMSQKVRLRTEWEFSEPGVIGRGVRQECLLSPMLFNIYIEEMMREAMEGVTEGVKVGGRLTKALRFADDQTMIVPSQKGLRRTMERLNKTSEEYDMKINIKQTKIMRISSGKERTVKMEWNWNKLEN